MPRGSYCRLQQATIGFYIPLTPLKPTSRQQKKIVVSAGAKNGVQLQAPQVDRELFLVVEGRESIGHSTDKIVDQNGELTEMQHDQHAAGENSLGHLEIMSR